MIINTVPNSWPSVVGIDVETTGLKFFEDRLLAVGVSDGDHVWIFTENFECLRPLLEDESITKIFHNFIFDSVFMYDAFPYTPVNVRDTMIQERLINNSDDKSVSNTLDSVVARRLGVFLDKEVRQTFIGYEGELTQEQLDYLAEDCKHLIAISAPQDADLHRMKMPRVVDTERRMLPVTFDMTVTGVGIDDDKNTALIDEVDAVLQQMLERLRFILGGEFAIDVTRKLKGEPYIKTIEIDDINFNSPDQIKATLHAKGHMVPDTQGKTLARYAGAEEVDLIIDYKKWRMIRRIKWARHVKKTGRIHAGWGQLGTITGRFAAKNPPLQQADRPKPDRPNVRGIFTALPGHKWVVGDFGQQEPRILAHVSQDKRMQAAANEADIYLSLAKDVYGETIKKSDPRRQKIKIGALALFYGGWYKNLAVSMGVTEREGKQFEERVFGAYPDAARWGAMQGAAVMNFGYTRSVWGRKMSFSSITKKNAWRVKKEARNLPIQSTAADMAKLAMCNLYDIIKEKKYDAHFMISMHDEIVMTCAEEDADNLLVDMIRVMEDAGREICPTVKFPVDGGVYDTWMH